MHKKTREIVLEKLRSKLIFEINRMAKFGSRGWQKD